MGHFIGRAALASHVHLWHASATCCSRHIARGMKRVTRKKLLRGDGRKEVLLTPDSLYYLPVTLNWYSFHADVFTEFASLLLSMAGYPTSFPTVLLIPCSALGII